MNLASIKLNFYEAGRRAGSEHSDTREDARIEIIGKPKCHVIINLDISLWTV